MKKWIATLTTAALVASVPAAALAAETGAIPSKLDSYYAQDSLDHWATADLNDFMQGDILAGYAQNGVVSVKPDGDITRAEFVAIVLRAADVKTSAGDAKFSDVKEGDWFYNAVATASSQGLIYGVGDDRFAPNERITRAEISAILNRFFSKTIDLSGEAKTFDDIKDHWAQPDIENISKAGIVSGYADGFKPDRNATRAEASSMIRRALHKEVKAAPTEQQLLETASMFHESMNGLIVAKDFAGVAKLVDDSTMGFLSEIETFSVDLFKSMLEELTEAGAKIDVSVSDKAGFKVVFASDRYAAVQVSGQKMETSITIGEETKKDSASTDETYLLRKVDGAWKIYGGSRMYEQFVKQMSAVKSE